MGRVLDERTIEVTGLIAGISSCEKALEDAVARRAPSNEVIQWYSGAMPASRAKKSIFLGLESSCLGVRSSLWGRW